MKSKLIKICLPDTLGAQTGRELLAKINGNALQEIFGNNVVDFQMDLPQKTRSLKSILMALRGWIDGADPVVALRLGDIILENDASLVYIEGSNYGRLARAIKLRHPECKIITFFHNVEARFFWGSFKSKPSLRSLGVMLANFVAESMAVKHSNRLICLTEKDSSILKLLYGRAATDVHSLCVDSFSDETNNKRTYIGTEFGLFVGGAFYANLEGVRWLAREVSSSCPCPIIIIGKGFESYRTELEAFPNIRVVGTVESVSEWYRDASFVVAPIFDGSGMKTKVAEALKYGKPVIGTAEAFVGYESVVNSIGYIFSDAESFASSIKSIFTRSVEFSEEELKEIFENHFSSNAKRRYFTETLSAIQIEGAS